MARQVPSPPQLAGGAREHGDASLVSDDEDVVADDPHGRIDVDEPLDLGAAVGRCHGRRPEQLAGRQRQRDDLAVVEAGEHHVAIHDRRSRFRAA